MCSVCFSPHFSLILLFPLFNRCWRTIANICVSLVGFGSTIVGLSRSKASVYSTFSSWYTISSCVYELRTTVTVVRCFWGSLRAGFVLCGPLPHLYCVTRRFLVISMPCVDCLVILIFCLCMCVNLNTNNGLIPFLPPLFFLTPSISFTCWRRHVLLVWARMTYVSIAVMWFSVWLWLCWRFQVSFLPSTYVCFRGSIGSTGIQSVVEFCSLLIIRKSSLSRDLSNVVAYYILPLYLFYSANIISCRMWMSMLPHFKKYQYDRGWNNKNKRWYQETESNRQDHRV